METRCAESEVQFRQRWIYVYLLIEFQASVDRFMAWRLMVYVGLLYRSRCPGSVGRRAGARRVDQTGGPVD